MVIEAKQIGTMMVTDPDDEILVELGVYKLAGGGIVAVDASYIDQGVVLDNLTDDVLLSLSHVYHTDVEERAVFFSPFDRGAVVVSD